MPRSTITALFLLPAMLAATQLQAQWLTQQLVCTSYDDMKSVVSSWKNDPARGFSRFEALQQQLRDGQPRCRVVENASLSYQFEREVFINFRNGTRYHIMPITYELDGQLHGGFTFVDWLKNGERT